MSSSYIAILYTTQGPVFVAVATINEARACLGQWMNQQPLRLGEAMAIITADTDRVVYFSLGAADAQHQRRSRKTARFEKRTAIDC